MLSEGGIQIVVGLEVQALYDSLLIAREFLALVVYLVLEPQISSRHQGTPPSGGKFRFSCLYTAKIP